MATLKISRLLAVSLFAALPLPAQIVSPNTNLDAREEQIIAAAKADAAPQFNGARMVGIRPGSPFLYSLAVTGAQPMTFTVDRLPAGLKFDDATGIINGAIAKAGNYTIRARAKNSAGRADTEVRIVCGDKIALLPPMGWNSYDAFGDSVVESEVLANAAWLKEHLQPLGWDTVVVDFRWYDSKADGKRVQNPEGVTIDANGRCIPPENRFPSAADGNGFTALADKIHAMGLKFGIHIMRGIPRKAVEADAPIAGSEFKASQAVLPQGNRNRVCAWNRDMYGVGGATEAGKAWYRSIARQYASWGVDYIKCDDISTPYRGDEINALSQGLHDTGRSIVLSLSPGPTPVMDGPLVEQVANLWRISGDFWDNWRSLSHNFDLFAAWQKNSGPGHWPDGDMIPFAHICQRNCDVRPDRWTRFTRNEQLTLMSLWALAPSPLMLGMNLPDNDDWTTAILTNPDVLAVNQDAAGQTGMRMTGPKITGEVWSKALADGSHAVGFFNRSGQTNTVAITWHDLGLGTKPAVRDLWVRKDLGKQKEFTMDLPPHGCVMLKVK
jgi:alpha-galactosidase